jgi:membrane protein implicated in regulation of membrane protease activity
MELYIFIICLAAGFTFALGSVIFGHLLGGGHDFGHAGAGHVGGSGGHAEGGLENTDMPGMSPFNPTLISCFIASFGGLGIIFHEIPATRPDYLSVPMALVGAFGIAAVLFYLLRALFRATQGSSESKLVDVIGLVAEVITPIPEKGVGEIAYVQKGARYSAPAREQSGEPVPNGRPVKIVRIAGSQFYVTAVYP